MAERRPLVLIDGELQELPQSDTIPGATASEDLDLYTKRIDFISDALLYKGYADAGTLESASAWRIVKVTIANDDDIVETFADGDVNFDNIWDNRLSLTYT
jgi:hypothetical protein